MTEKFDKNLSEKTNDMMRKISGEGFKSDDSVDKMIDKFGDMIMEIKKIKLVEKVGITKTVRRILEVMTEKFDRNMSEKMIDMMRKISGEGFRSDESVDKMVDRFEDMILEMKKIKLAENLDYAMGLQFLERVEKSGKVSVVEKKILRDILEDGDGNPKEGETLELMKRELKRMKVAENREEPFKKKEMTYYQEDTTYYVRNNEDNRSRRDNWRSKSYVRSSSCPGYYRTASRNNYVRDNSSFRRFQCKKGFTIWRKIYRSRK